nr:hypothetical protein [Hyphomonas sp. Mor2]
MSLDNLPSIYVHKTPASEAAASGARMPAFVIWTIALVTFLVLTSLVANLYRSAHGMPYMAVLTEKLEDYDKQSADYDVIFLGTSETFRHIDPSAISAVLADNGHELDVYNFGVPALNYSELSLLTDRIADNPADGRKFVVIQNPLPVRGDLDTLLTDRGRYFRNGARVGNTVSEVACYTGTSLGLLRRIYSNSLAVTAETTGFGRLANTLFPAAETLQLTYDPAYRNNHGFWPVDRDLTDHVVARQGFASMTPDKMQAYIDGQGMRAPRESQLACRAGLILDLVTRLEAAGYTVIYLNPPTVKFSPLSNAVRDAALKLDPDLLVLDFDPAIYTEFTEPSLWFDESHMTGEGAERLSRLIGAELATLLAEVDTTGSASIATDG